MIQSELEEMPLLIAKIEEWSKLRGIDKLPYQEQRYKIATRLWKSLENSSVLITEGIWSC